MDHDVDVVLDDQLRWTYERRLTPGRVAELTAAERRRKFLERWYDRDSLYTDDSEIQSLLVDPKDLANPKDIGADYGRGDGSGNHNDDIVYLIRNVSILIANQPQLSLAAAQYIVMMDRGRRIAYGYVRPPPRSMVWGRDGGIDLAPLMKRRPRPELPAAQDRSSPGSGADSGVGPGGGCFPRNHDGSDDSPCRPPPPTRLGPGRPHPALNRFSSTPSRNKGKGKGVDTGHSRTRSHNISHSGRRDSGWARHRERQTRTEQLQRRAALLMLRQPLLSVADTAFRLLNRPD